MSYMGIQELKDADLKSGSATGDGSTTTFAIGWTPPSEQSLFVTINGVLQSASALSISGANCVFTAAPASADAIEFKGIQSSGTVVTTTGDGTIDAAKLADNSVTAVKILASSVTNAKLADDAVTSAKIIDDAVTIAKLAATGTAQAGTYLQGDNTWGAIASSGFNSVQVFTTSGTWTKPTDITKIIVEVQGAGGGGGGGGVSKGDGGGGGGYARKFLDVTNIDTVTVTVGAAGAGGASNSPGLAGGLSSFVKLTGSGSFTDVVGNGGVQGQPNNLSGGAGGTATGGDIHINGGYGGGYTNENNVGGGSFFSPQHYSGSSGTPNPPDAATGYGGGGEGSRGTTGYSGAAGTVGLVYVQEYK